MRPNELTLFFISLVFIIPILIFDSVVLDIALVFWSILNLIFFKRLKLKTLFYFFIVILIPLISVFFTTILYAKSKGEILVLFGVLKTSESNLKLALYLTVRTFSLSFISFAYLVALEYDKFIISLMENFRLPVTVGYSLLVTFNAFYHLKDEFIRIKNVYKMRFGKNKNPLFLFFPIIVSAARYAYHAGLSLQSRGLNPNKTFYKNEKLKKIDLVILIVNIIFSALLIFYFVSKSNLRVKLM